MLRKIEGKSVLRIVLISRTPELTAKFQLALDSVNFKSNIIPEIELIVVNGVAELRQILVNQTFDLWFVDGEYSALDDGTSIADLLRAYSSPLAVLLCESLPAQQLKNYAREISAAIVSLAQESNRDINLQVQTAFRLKQERLSLAGQIEDERFLKELAVYSANVGIDAVDQALEHTLRCIVDFSGLDLAFIVNRGTDEDYRLTHGSSRLGSNVVQPHKQTLPREFFPWFRSTLDAGERIIATTVTALPPNARSERDFFFSHGLKSILAVPFVTENLVRGALFLGSDRLEFDFEEKQIDFLKQLAEIVCGLLSRSYAAARRVKRLRELVGDTEATFRNVVESLNEGVSCCDAEGNVIYSNASMERITGFAWEDIRGKKVYEFYFRENDPGYEELKVNQHKRYRDRLLGYSEEYELQVVRKDGERRWVEIKASPLRDAFGKVVGSIGVVADVTERKLLESQFRWSQKMEAVGRLAGGVAHDFNNLLTVISGYSNMLLKKMDKSTAEYRKINAIREASDAACSLTQQLLTVSRRRVMQPTLIDINDSVRHGTGIINGLIGDNISLSTDLQEKLPRIKIDPGQLQQIIMNLAINARDAMPDGGQLRIETYEVGVNSAQMAGSIRRLEPGRYVVLTMSDSGCGMDEDVQSHLFEPFYTTKSDGTGLGLSTVYGIVEQAGGNISVFSEPGAGSTFSVFFPSVAEKAQLYDSGQEAKQKEFINTETVLLVEDEHAVRELVCEILEKSGFTVLVAEHGKQALQIYADSQARIDLILTDVAMPQMDGFELVQILAEKECCPRILMMSGCTHQSDIAQKIIDRGLPFLPKPFSPDDLVLKMRQVLDVEKVRRQAVNQ